MKTGKGFGKGARRRAHESHSIRGERASGGGSALNRDVSKEAAKYIEEHGLDDKFFLQLRKLSKNHR